MGVLGVGIDLVGVESFAEQLAAGGSAFADQTFTAAELRAGSGPAGAAQHLAGRYAAKEAFVKAFSGARPGRAPVAPAPGLAAHRGGFRWLGRPGLRLHESVAAAVRASLGEVVIQVSITHEPSMAAAVVVLESAQALNEIARR